MGGSIMDGIFVDCNSNGHVVPSILLFYFYVNNKRYNVLQYFYWYYWCDKNKLFVERYFLWEYVIQNSGHACVTYKRLCCI